MDERKPTIFLAQPLYCRDVDCGSILAATINATGGKLTVAYSRHGGSSLPQVFNNLWVQALGQRDKYTHFAMLHSDVEPEGGWLDILYDELIRTQATVMSAVVAIKDEKGVSSTAVGVNDDLYDYRRITMTELMKLPQTFSVADVRAAGIWPDYFAGETPRCLLVNTGCWITDLSWPGWHVQDEQGFFKFKYEQLHRIQQWPDGRYNCEFAPEDWLMSRYVANNGGRVMATRLFKTIHVGTQLYPNWQAWGKPTDAEIDRHLADKRRAFAMAEGHA
ncbi:MAG: hypothetical protein WC655_25005 [Candidatus Hydrogenedentales bacterium]|jgi:hypothetical protein